MSAAQKVTPTLNFKTVPYTIGPWTILRLPQEESAKFPSRGQVVVEGTINGVALKTPLEPDGKWSHWFNVDTKLRKAAKISAGDTVTLSIKYTSEWPEPEIPKDLQDALAADHEARELWQQVTPMARWEWVRWTRSTNNSETRKRRIEVACSKLRAGKRRPCCWNRNLCTEPSVAKNGVLLDAPSA